MHSKANTCNARTDIAQQGLILYTWCWYCLAGGDIVHVQPAMVDIKKPGLLLLNRFGQSIQPVGYMMDCYQPLTIPEKLQIHQRIQRNLISSRPCYSVSTPKTLPFSLNFKRVSRDWTLEVDSNFLTKPNCIVHNIQFKCTKLEIDSSTNPREHTWYIHCSQLLKHTKRQCTSPVAYLDGWGCAMAPLWQKNQFWP